VWSNSIPIKSQKLLTGLIGRHYTETCKLRIQILILKSIEILGSLKHVINIILKIRCMECYSCYMKESGRGPLGRLNGGRGGRVVVFTGEQRRQQAAEGKASRGAKAVEAERKFPGPTCAFYSRARRWRSAMWQQKQWWGHGLDAGARSGRQRSDKEAGRWVPCGWIFSKNFQKRFNF
jgi:hypothetical protein